LIDAGALGQRRHLREDRRPEAGEPARRGEARVLIIGAYGGALEPSFELMAIGRQIGMRTSPRSSSHH
jgi:hypothetical protein